MNRSLRPMIKALVASLLLVNLTWYERWMFPSTLTNMDIPSIGTNDTASNIQPTFRLLPTDSIYHQYNMSTTPIVLPKYKLLLFTCEKVGSTVLRQLMRRMMGYPDYQHHGGGIPHAYPKNGLRYLHLYPIEEANTMMTSEEWTRAMFVRDPKERSLSGFLMWKPKNGTRGGSGPLAKCCNERTDNVEGCLHHLSTFDGFLDMIEDPSTVKPSRNNETMDSPMGNLLRRSPSCPDKHWSPITHWRMEERIYPQLNFIGHLETARWDIRRLMDRLHPRAWEEYGAGGWGEFGNESMFESSGTVLHAKGTENLLEGYYGGEVEGRVERIYEDDYRNGYLELDRVRVGEASRHYKEKFAERYPDYL